MLIFILELTYYKNMIQQILSDWTEKYRPKSLEDIVLTAEASALIKKYIKDLDL